MRFIGYLHVLHLFWHKSIYFFLFSIVFLVYYFLSFFDVVNEQNSLNDVLYLSVCVNVYFTFIRLLNYGLWNEREKCDYHNGRRPWQSFIESGLFESKIIFRLYCLCWNSIEFVANTGKTIANEIGEGWIFKQRITSM